MMAVQLAQDSQFHRTSVSDGRLRAILALTTALVAVPALADPLPTGGTVVQGSVGISTTNPTAMVLNQSTDRAVVNWNSFNIGSGARVDIVQPNSSSALLNRVTGNTGTEIHGQMNANGQVFVVNPNGIFIGADGTIQTGGGFVASTLDISDDDFARGNLKFTGNGQSGTVSNAGAITIGPGGYAALMGGKVRNSGTIVVPAGRIGFAAGEYVTLDVSGDQFLQVAIPSGDDGDSDALIENSGTVSATGGRIEMRAATAREAARNAINMSGVAEARSVTKRGGVIILGGGGGGKVRVSGKVTTASRDTATPVSGGQIDITGQDIALNGAAIDASGTGNGGSIRIGGDAGGLGTLPHADFILSDADTTLKADAGTTGNGGRIVLWSDRDTRFLSFGSVRGGSDSGDGGFVEISSAEKLFFGGLVDRRAENGKWGLLLLDPTDITIPGTITEATLEANLDIGDVVLDTASGGGDAGDITIDVDINWSAATELYLRADNNIVLNGAIDNANGLFRLSADGSITTSAAGAVNVDDFFLEQGDWTQVTATLPGFTVGTSFGFQDYSSSFLRATGGDGGNSPYQLTDIYGVQGISTSGSNSNSYILMNDIDASGTATWGTGSNGSGFNAINGFGGDFDGGRYAIRFLTQDADNGEGYGLVGMFSTITGGASVHDLTLDSIDFVGGYGGGLTYNNSGSIYNVHVNGRLTTYGDETGGIVGTNSGDLRDSISNVGISVLLDTIYSIGSTTVGGAVGYNEFYGTIERVGALGNIDVTNFNSDFTVEGGGLVGSQNGFVYDSYALGDISVDFGVATDATVSVGGFAGTSTESIYTSFSAGSVPSGPGVGVTNFGGFLGQDFTSGGDFSTNFWDTTTSGTGTSAGGTGITTAQFQNTDTFYALGNGAGWDFSDVWAPGDTGYYPVNYTTSLAVFTIPTDDTAVYGTVESLTPVYDLSGGSSIYVFDDPNDTLDTAGFVPAYDFGGVTVGAQTMVMNNASINSTLGNVFRMVTLTAEVNITPAPLTITADDQTKVYGSTFTFAGTEFGTTGLVYSDAVTGLTLTSAGAVNTATVAGSPYTVAASGATGSGLSNYTITYVAGSMDVTPAPLTISADDQTKLQGEEIVFDGTEFTAVGLVNTDTVDSVSLTSAGAPASASPTGSPYAIDVSNAVGTGLANYGITYDPGTLTITVITSPPPPVVIPPPPNPGDDPPPVFSGPADPGQPTLVADPGGSADVLPKIDDAATTLEVSAKGCAQSDADVTRYLACLSDALNDFANELDKLSTELPPGMENIASIVQDARRSIDASSARAASRLATATTDAERAAIRTDAINEARGAIATASSEIRKTISLVRAEDPELASLQRATINKVANAVDSVGIELSRAVGL